MTKYWESLRYWRWHGYRKWHNWSIGPLCLSFYVYPSGQPVGGNFRSRLFLTHSWRYVDPNGDGHHLSSFKRWCQKRKKTA